MVDGSPTPRIRWGALAASSLLFAMLPVAFCAVYVAILGAPKTALPGHAQVVGLAWLALFSVRAAILATPLDRAWRDALGAFAIALLVVSASIYYILVVVGLVSWGRVISTELMVVYFAQAPDLLAVLEIPPVLGVLALATLFSAVWAIALAYVRRFDWIASLMHQRPRAFVLGLALALASITVIRAAELEHSGWAHLGEPLSLTLYPEQGETWRSIRLPNSRPDPNAPARTAELDRLEDAIRSAYRPNPDAIKPNVIVISVDALRADHMSVLGYARPTTPHLLQLQRSGNLAHASSSYAVCTESACGLLAIANSRYADGSPSRPLGLPAVLRLHGYAVHMILSGDHTHFYGLREAYGRVDSYYDGASQSARYVNDDRLVLDRVRSLAPWDGTPAMFQFHLMSSHLLGSRFDETPSFGPSENYSKIRFLPDRPGARERAINFYDRGVLQTDRVIHELLELLRQRDYLRNAVVVITADHGEALGEHGLYTHTNGVVEAQLRIPLVIVAFGEARIAPARASALLSPVDIAPTIADALGMPIPASWEGRPLRLVQAPRQVYFSQGNWEGLVSQDADGRIYKYWVDRRKVDEYAYELTADPAERHNIAAKLPLPVKMAWLDALNARAGREPQKLRLGLHERGN
ncbi:MAG TPA: sulfatase-like hydrolase/transferase [Burkholderiales bacterium]|nr:sulfatase-like hydrolase/transferase [Burkholderiales bacterium]